MWFIIFWFLNGYSFLSYSHSLTILVKLHFTLEGYLKLYSSSSIASETPDFSIFKMVVVAVKIKLFNVQKHLDRNVGT